MDRVDARGCYRANRLVTGVLRRLAALRTIGTLQGRQTAFAGVLSIGLRAISLLGKFAFIVVLAKYTDPSTVGIYALLVTIVTISIYVIGLEIHTFTNRELASDKGETDGATHIQSHFVTLVGMFALTLPIILYSVFWFDLGGKFSLALFSAVLLLEIFGHELGRYLLILSRPVAANFLQFLRGAAWMPMTIAALLAYGRDGAIDIILWGWLGGAAAACLFGMAHVRRFLKPIQRYRFAWLYQAFFSARHYFGLAMLTQVQYYSDRFIVQRVMGESAVGVLSFYQSFANTMVAFVQTGVISVMLPRLLLAASRRDLEAESRVRRSMFVWATALALGISATLAVGMPLLLTQMDKAAYGPSLSVFYVLLAGNLVFVASAVMQQSLYARRRDVQLVRISLVIVPLGLIANALVVPAYGIMGAATVFCIVSSVDFAAKVLVLRRSVDQQRAKAVQ